MNYAEANKLIELSNTGTIIITKQSLTTECATIHNLCSITATNELEDTISAQAFEHKHMTHTDISVTI
jgi:hypothetical protein